MPRIDIESLKESNEFLNDLYQNVTSAIFIADSDARIYHFNDSFRTLFYKPEDQILKQLCGNVMGCIFAVEEGRNCGETSQCADCILRNNIIRTFTEKVPAYKEELARKFLIDGRVLEKHFIFTTKYLNYRGDEMILVIVDDVSEQVEQREQIRGYYSRLLAELREKVDEYADLRRQLSDETSRKDALRRELDHRIGNSLQIISSLMRLHLTDIRDPQVERYCIEIMNRVNVIKTLYQHLKNEPTFSRVDLHSFIHALLDSIERETSLSAPPFALERSIEPLHAAIDTALPLGLILHEFVSEELKSPAFGGTVEVTLADSAAGAPRIVLSRAEAPADGSGNSSMGSVLIDILCRQMGAEVEREPVRGDRSRSSGIRIQL